MFKAELIGNSKIFEDAFESISRIVDEVVCEVDSEGFRVNAIDRSHVCFASLNLEKTVFDEYVCSVPEKICLDTEEFKKILKRGKKNDILTLELEDDSDSNSLVVTFDGEVTRTFKIKLIDISYETPMPPNLDLPCSFEIPSGMVKDCLTDMSLFSDVLSFQMDSEYFTSFTNGEFGDTDFKYLHGENITDTVKSSFSIDKLSDIFNASKFSDLCRMSIGDNMPVSIVFKLPSDDGSLSFLLAPRLEEEE